MNMRHESPQWFIKDKKVHKWQSNHAGSLNKLYAVAV